MGTKQSTTKQENTQQENTRTTGTTGDDQINSTLDASVAASKQAKEEAETIAGEATELSEKVHSQGVQIHNIHTKAKKIEENAKKGEKEESRLEWWGCCYRSFQSSRVTDEDPGDKVVPKKPSHHPHSSSSDERIVDRIVDDSREDEINDNLKDVSKALDVISDANDEIGAELDKQNEELGQITDDETITGDTLARVNERLKKHE